jgi:hypothetical protein
LTALHRTLLQTSAEPEDGPESLAALLAELDAMDAVGVIVPTTAPVPEDPSRNLLRFSFLPFPARTDQSGQSR